MEPNRLDELLPSELIALEEPPADKSACIEYLLDLVAGAGRVDDRERALGALRRREAEATTGVGRGIGIPHAKTDAVDRASVAFARSRAGVEFESVDDEPVHLVFLLLVPEDGADEHLSILSGLSRSLMRDEVRAGLYDAATPAEVRAVLKRAIAE